MLFFINLLKTFNFASVRWLINIFILRYAISLLKYDILYPNFFIDTKNLTIKILKNIWFSIKFFVLQLSVVFFGIWCILACWYYGF